MPKKSSPPAEPERFEDALSELEEIVKALEHGEQTLEESLKQFERGVALSRFCQNSLDNAEQQVKILLEETGQSGDEQAEKLTPFEDEL